MALGSRAYDLGEEPILGLLFFLFFLGRSPWKRKGRKEKEERRCLVEAFKTSRLGKKTHPNSPFVLVFVGLSWV